MAPEKAGTARWASGRRVGGVDALAREGFGRGAEAYERGRPAYPPEAVAWACAALGIGPGSLVLDVGAGTGKLALLASAVSGARVVGVEPVEEMREIAAASGLVMLDGTAERLPVADDSVDAVVC